MGTKVRKIGIDFGTSTSVICYQDYNKADGKLVPEGKCEVLRQGNSKAIPTAIVEADESLNIYEDLFGHQALDASNNPRVKLRINFKMGLFSNSTPEEKAEDIRLTVKYFKFIKRLYDEANQLSSEAALEYEFITYVSFPVRAIFTEQDYVVDAAQKANFPNVQRMNEAEGALMQAFGRKDSSIRAYLKGYTVYDTMNILLVDMGAGTTDITLYKYSCGADRNQLKELASWPEPGQNKTLGGKEIDALLLKYCKDNHLIDEMMCSSSRFDAVLLDDCKNWKEVNISPALKLHRQVESLGKLSGRSFYSENIYEGDFVINNARLEGLLRNYLVEFCEAVKRVLERGQVKEEELDFVISVGGNSQWYFVKDIFLSTKLDSGLKFPGLNLRKIHFEPGRYITDDEPQLFVAKGLVIVPDEIEWKPISKHEIKLQLALSTKSASGYGSPQIRKVFDLDLLVKDQVLPVQDASFNESVTFNMLKSDVIGYSIMIYTIERDKNKVLYTGESYCPRNLSTAAKSLGNTVLKKASNFVGAFSDSAKDMIDSIIPTDWINTNVKASIGFSFNEAENLRMSLKLSSPTHWETPVTISIR